jgi:hypothetical protein
MNRSFSSQRRQSDIGGDCVYRRCANIASNRSLGKGRVRKVGGESNRRIDRRARSSAGQGERVGDLDSLVPFAIGTAPRRPTSALDMDDNLYTPPKSPVGDPVPPRIQSRRDPSLIWRVIFLCLFAALNFYFALPGRGNISYLVLGCLCLVSAGLLLRLSPWSRYPLVVATLIMGAALIDGIHNYAANSALSKRPPQQQVISWLIPLVPTVLLVACCAYARRLSRRV